MNQSFRLISEDEWREIQKQADEIVQKKDTLISGEIVILKLSNRFAVKETTDKGQLVIHMFPDLPSAQKLVDARLKIYEQMWNGCGCKINYFANHR